VKIGKQRYAGWLLWILLATGAVSGCAVQDGETESPGTRKETGKETAAERLLKEAAAAADKLKNYEIRMHLEQSLDHQGAKENVKVDASGTVSRNPLQMAQTVTSDYDGDVTTIKTILTPDNYYVNDTLIGVWNRLPKEEIEAVTAALSNFQTDPGALLESMQPYAGGFEAVPAGEGAEGLAVLRLTEEDEGARELLGDILTSTLGAGVMEERVRDSIKLNKLVYKVTLDPAAKRLTRLDVVSEMDMAFEADVRTKVTQTLTVKYDKFDAAGPVEVPEEAKDAPEIMEPGAGIPELDDPLADPDAGEPGADAGEPGTDAGGLEPGTDARENG